MFEQIIFIKEHILGYSIVVSQMLCGYNPKQYKIKSTADIKHDDIIGVTIFNADSIAVLKRIRKQFPNNTIICGGIGCYALYNRLLLYADYIYFGEGFEFDYSSVLGKKDNPDKIKIKRDFDYNKVPLVKYGKHSYRMLVEVGCPFKCEYCYVSHVNPYSRMGDDVFRKRVKFIDKRIKGCSIALVGNEGLLKERNAMYLGDTVNKYNQASITVKQFLKNKSLYAKQGGIQLGVELPTEQLRLSILPTPKKITDAELIEVVRSDCRDIQLYYIWNYVGVNITDYADIYNIAIQKTDKRLRLNFTHLEIQPYTKLISRIGEHIEQTLNSKGMRESKIMDKCGKITGVKVFPPKNPISALKNYTNAYTTKSPSSKLTDILINEIVDNANKMKMDNDYIYIHRF